MKFQEFKNILSTNVDTFIKFFKGNKNMQLVLYKRNVKKSGDDSWDEEFRFDNNELSLGDYKVLIENLAKLQPYPIEAKKLGGLHIRAQYNKNDAVKLGKQLSVRVCQDVIKLLELVQHIS
jgi:hypothetical protein